MEEKGKKKERKEEKKRVIIYGNGSDLVVSGPQQKTYLSMKEKKIFTRLGGKGQREMISGIPSVQTFSTS